jgi:hypothetical protein
VEQDLRFHRPERCQGQVYSGIKTKKENTGPVKILRIRKKRLTTLINRIWILDGPM